MNTKGQTMKSEENHRQSKGKPLKTNESQRKSNEHQRTKTNENT